MMMNIVVGNQVHEDMDAAKRHNLAGELIERIRTEKLTKKLEAYFTAIDTDQSEVIDKDEMELAMQELEQHLAAPGDDDGLLPADQGEA